MDVHHACCERPHPSCTTGAEELFFEEWPWETQQIRSEEIPGICLGDVHFQSASPGTSLGPLRFLRTHSCEHMMGTD